ncbi:winged helix DNA-binding protein [Sphingomonas xanthus]|uniref:Uncharacterized protein n=1 Tax=Sphingomonas xanthus TaxID=2594473 RepID=A0A516IU69_9SPHN|nr:winged helix DNA-binding protein [Sphingomonas xanthus]QDP20420.1 hypothetical protein FMM02_10925 [Sphingomonas xanthus]
MTRSFAGLSAHLAHIAPTLSRSPRAGADGDDLSAAEQCRMVDTILRTRRLRTSFFDDVLFADPAWDILLDLYMAELQQRRVTVSSLCVGANVPQTTALRWIKLMTDQGLLRRLDDTTDARRKIIELSPEAAMQMRDYLRGIHALMPSPQ